MSISVCIPTMRRFSFLKESIPKYLTNPHVTEVVITDETGEDYAAITSAFSDPKLRVYQNERRLGAVENKQRAASYATSDFVAIIDSDNFADVQYFKAFKEYVANNVITDSTLFLPCAANPTFKYHRYVGRLLTKDTVRTYWPDIETCLNTMNLIISRKFLSTFNLMSDTPMCVDANGAYDALYFSLYALGDMNAVLVVVPDMEYEHRIHAGSWYMESESRSRNVYKVLLKRYLQIG